MADVVLDVLGSDEGKLASLTKVLASSEGMLYELPALVAEPVSLKNSVSVGEDERMKNRHSIPYYRHSDSSCRGVDLPAES